MEKQSATSDEIAEWNKNNDEPHPVFEVSHRPERHSVTPERTPFNTVQLTAPEYIALLYEHTAFVLRITNGPNDNTFRFWVENDTLHWQCSTWTQSRVASTNDLDACLTSTATPQFLREK